MSHAFSEIFIHLSFHCAHDRNLITPEAEPVLHRFLEEDCAATKGVFFRAVGGTSNHVHLAFQMEPFLVLSKFIGQIKGRSSHNINETYGKDFLHWQRGYGAVSFSRQQLPIILNYVARQKEHHERGTTNETLERWGDEGDEPEEC